MDIKVKTWRGTMETDLAAVASGACEDDQSGMVESTRGTVHNTADMLGRLIEALVERQALTIKEAQEIIGWRGGEIVE